MRISPNIGMQNRFLNVHRINQGFDQNSYDLKNKEQHERKDSVSISPLGKANSFIESLMKQKQNIIERKNELISNTLEKGGSMDSIKTMLESYEDQLKSIDEQIAQTMAKQAKQQVEKQKEAVNTKPKTEEEIQAKRLNSIVSSSLNVKQAQVVSSVKTKVDGDAGILKFEIEIDKARAGSSPSAKKFIAKKEARLAEMQNRSANLTAQIGEKLVDVNEEIKENDNSQTVKPENPDTTKNNDLNAETKDKTEIAD